MAELRGNFATIPSSKDVFRPRADESIYRAVKEAALAHYKEVTFPPELTTECGEHVAQMLERNYPAADMAILRRYGLTEEIQNQSISIKGGGNHYARAGIELPRKVEVPRYGAETVASQPYAWTEANNFGLLPKFWEGDPKRAAECVAEHKRGALRHEKWLIAAKFRPMFDEITAARELFRQMTETAYHYPVTFKMREGRWPTWQEIEADCPAIGAFMEGERLRRSAQKVAA